MRRALVCFVLLSSVSAFAQSTCRELVPKLMDASGLTRSLALLPEAMREMTEAQLDREGSMPVDTKRALEDVMTHGFDVDRITRNTTSKMLSSCDASAYAAVLADMQSPLGQKMVQLQLDPMSSPEATTRMRHFIAAFAMQSPRESRLNLIHDLMDTTKEAEISTDEALQVTLTMTRTAFNVSPSADQVDAFRQEMLSRIRDVMVARYYYIYRSCTDDELQQITVMEATKPVQRFNQDVAKALLFAFSEETTDLAGKLKKIVNDEKVKHGE